MKIVVDSRHSCSSRLRSSRNDGCSASCTIEGECGNGVIDASVGDDAFFKGWLVYGTNLPQTIPNVEAKLKAAADSLDLIVVVEDLVPFSGQPHHAQLDAPALAVDRHHAHLDFIAHIQHVAGVLDVAVRQAGNVDQAVWNTRHGRPLAMTKHWAHWPLAQKIPCGALSLGW